MDDFKNLTDEQLEELIRTEYREKIIDFAKLAKKEEIAIRLIDSLDNKESQTPTQRLFLQKIKNHMREGTFLSKLVLGNG